MKTIELLKHVLLCVTLVACCSLLNDGLKAVGAGFRDQGRAQGVDALQLQYDLNMKFLREQLESGHIQNRNG